MPLFKNTTGKHYLSSVLDARKLLLFAFVFMLAFLVAMAFDSSARTKELLGLVASMVLRCDDCITYHLVRCGEAGWKRDEVIDALNVATVVGGSITIPHLRRAFARMREIQALAPGVK